MIDADDAMRTLAVTLAVERSGRDGRPVTMAEMLADENRQAGVVGGGLRHGIGGPNLGGLD